MSALPSASWINESTPLWMRDGGSYSNVSISSINTDQIVLDGQTLDATSSAGGTLLINGIAIASAATLTSSITNWAQFPALSSITYTTSGGSGGLINMSIGQFSTLTNITGSINALTVSSINGANAASSVGVSRAMSTAHAVQDNGAVGTQTLVFVNDNAVPLVAGQWYLVSAVITTTVNVSLAGASDVWYYQCGLTGGTFAVNNPSTQYWAQAVGVYNQAGSTRQNQYTFTQMVKCSTSGTAITLTVVANLPSQVGTGGTYQWNCSNFDISPLGGQLN